MEKINDFLKPYLHIEDIDGNEKPSWNFAAKIATAENCSDECVLEAADILRYPIYKIEAPSFCRFAVAAKQVTADEIYEDFASYLEGSSAAVIPWTWEKCCK